MCQSSYALSSSLGLSQTALQLLDLEAGGTEAPSDVSAAMVAARMIELLAIHAELRAAVSAVSGAAAPHNTDDGSQESCCQALHSKDGMHLTPLQTFLSAHASIPGSLRFVSRLLTDWLRSPSKCPRIVRASGAEHSRGPAVGTCRKTPGGLHRAAAGPAAPCAAAVVRENAAAQLDSIAGQPEDATGGGGLCGDAGAGGI